MWSDKVYQRGPIWQSWDWSLTNMLLVLLVILLVIVIVYLVFFPRLESVKSSASIQTEVEEITEEEQNKSLEVALKLMESDERRVVETIIKAGGSMLQKDISYELKISRVKTHRILVKLINRGIVIAEKKFNTNNITLADWLQ